MVWTNAISHNVKKKGVVGIKGTNERYVLRELPTNSMQLLEYNLMKNNIEGSNNVYL